ncbi:hypothetical protein IMSHALPRED_006597 [Imshaugia aleurites]|uniref:Carboxypeptidase n=1 Tax=Imshaugia aleurites TaxID=172621 RepID=A0A8H3EMV9_9LECA|nr:hypothetical protein IMSHALPRED_006597 [Imshaugia aleurites]
MLVVGLLSFIASTVNAVPSLEPRQIPANATDVTTIQSPTGVTIRYKEPGKAGVCETTPGVGSYAGYVDLSPTSHTFFWFFEARRNPETAPLTLWLNGGPGSDSLIGLFQELGPCNVTQNLTTVVNEHSWSEVSNLLFISQPLGTGFSYSEEEPGSFNPYTGEQENSSYGVTGEWPVINATELSTTDLAAVATWHVLQGFLSALPQLDGKVANKTFNLWTESYGGHYGPAFYNYFYDQNELIANGTANGTQLIFDTLGIGNGIISESIQAPWYPEFAVNNTYGIKAVNDTVYEYMKFACYMIGGCLDQCVECETVNRSTDVGMQTCFMATDMCRTNVESPYYMYSGRGVYDIRHPYEDPTPPTYFTDYLNLASTQDALGVNLNYTESNNDVYYAFQQTGDFVYPNFLTDLEMILNNSVRVAMYHGDADYICNWFGGQAVSLQIDYIHSAEFRAAGYAPFVVDGIEYGEVRQYGNYSFTRIYEAGHEVPFYQPIAALAMFSRVLGNVDLATGEKVVTGSYETNGTVNATHTEPYVAIPTVTGSGSSLLSFTAAITAPITSVPPEGDQVVETASATTHEVYGRFLKRDLDLQA